MCDHHRYFEKLLYLGLKFAVCLLLTTLMQCEGRKRRRERVEKFSLININAEL